MPFGITAIGRRSPSSSRTAPARKREHDVIAAAPRMPDASTLAHHRTSAGTTS